MSDSELIEQCLAGDSDSWDRLHALCTPAIAAAAKFLLGHRSSLVEDVVGATWLDLLRDNHRLLRAYDGERASLRTYVGIVAKNRARVIARSENRRRKRQHKVCRYEVVHEETVDTRGFPDTLSKAERRAYDALIGSGQFAGSKANEWQLRHRVREKLERFMGVSA